MKKSQSKVLIVFVVIFGSVTLLGYFFGNYFKNNPVYVLRDYHRLMGGDVFLIQNHKFNTPRHCYRETQTSEFPRFSCAVSPTELKSVSILKATVVSESELEKLMQFSEVYEKEGDFLYIAHGPKQGSETTYHLYIMPSHGLFVSADTKELANEFTQLIATRNFSVR